MKKPVNRLAVIIWIVAALNAVAQFVVEPLLHQWTVAAAPEFQRADALVHLTLVYWHLSNVRSGLVITVFLITCGAVIELLDSIRWEVRNRQR